MYIFNMVRQDHNNSAIDRNYDETMSHPSSSSSPPSPCTTPEVSMTILKNNLFLEANNQFKLQFYNQCTYLFTQTASFALRQLLLSRYSRQEQFLRGEEIKFQVDHDDVQKCYDIIERIGKKWMKLLKKEGYNDCSGVIELILQRGRFLERRNDSESEEMEKLFFDDANSKKTREESNKGIVEKDMDSVRTTVITNESTPQTSTANNEKGNHDGDKMSPEITARNETMEAASKTFPTTIVAAPKETLSSSSSSSVCAYTSLFQIGLNNYLSGGSFLLFNSNEAEETKNNGYELNNESRNHWKPLPSHSPPSSSSSTSFVHIPKATILNSSTTQNNDIHPKQLFGRPPPTLLPFPWEKGEKSKEEWIQSQINTLDGMMQNGKSCWYHDYQVIQDAATRNKERMHLKHERIRRKRRKNSGDLSDNEEDGENDEGEEQEFEIVPKNMDLNTDDDIQLINKDDSEEAKENLSHDIDQDNEEKNKNDDDAAPISSSSTFFPQNARYTSTLRRKKMKQSKTSMEAPLIQNKNEVNTKGMKGRPPNTTIQDEESWSWEDDVLSNLPLNERQKLERQMIHEEENETKGEVVHVVQGALKHVGLIHKWEQHQQSLQKSQPNVEDEEEEEDNDSYDDDDNDDEYQKERTRLERKAKRERLGYDLQEMENDKKRRLPSEKRSTKIVRAVGTKQHQQQKNDGKEVEFQQEKEVDRADDENKKDIMEEEWMELDLGECLLEITVDHDHCINRCVDQGETVDKKEKGEERGGDVREKKLLSFRSLEVSLCFKDDDEIAK